MAQQTINSTDTLNAGRVKINDNFTELFKPTETALVDGAAITLSAAKHTLSTAEAAITFTDTYAEDYLAVEVTLNGITASTWTFPAGSLCILDGVASGDNTIAISGAVAGDKILLSRWDSGTKKYYVATNFGQ